MAGKKTYKRKYQKWKKRARGKYARRTSFKSRVRKILLKTAETKKYQFADENVQLYHNIGYSAAVPVAGANAGSLIQPFNVWAGITKGTSSFNRIGDRIIPRGMSLKIWMANKLDRPNLMYRVIVCTIPKTLGGVVSTYNNVDLFDTTQLGATGNRLILNLDRDRGVKALYDKVFSAQPGIAGNYNAAAGAGAGKEYHILKKLWIKRKSSRPIQFDSTNAQQIVNNPLYVYVIPYDSYGTLISDNVASCSYYGVCYFKDI